MSSQLLPKGNQKNTKKFENQKQALASAMAVAWGCQSGEATKKIGGKKWPKGWTRCFFLLFLRLLFTLPILSSPIWLLDHLNVTTYLQRFAFDTVGCEKLVTADF
jgi:hypothetical protein